MSGYKVLGKGFEGNCWRRCLQFEMRNVIFQTSTAVVAFLLLSTLYKRLFRENRGEWFAGQILAKFVKCLGDVVKFEKEIKESYERDIPCLKSETS